MRGADDSFGEDFETRRSGLEQSFPRLPERYKDLQGHAHLHITPTKNQIHARFEFRRRVSLENARRQQHGMDLHTTHTGLVQRPRHLDSQQLA